MRFEFAFVHTFLAGTNFFLLIIHLYALTHEHSNVYIYIYIYIYIYRYNVPPQ